MDSMYEITNSIEPWGSHLSSSTQYVARANPRIVHLLRARLGPNANPINKLKIDRIPLLFEVLPGAGDTQLFDIVRAYAEAQGFQAHIVDCSHHSIDELADMLHERIASNKRSALLLSHIDAPLIEESANTRFVTTLEDCAKSKVNEQEVRLLVVATCHTASRALVNNPTVNILKHVDTHALRLLSSNDANRYLIENQVQEGHARLIEGYIRGHVGLLEVASTFSGKPSLESLAEHCTSHPKGRHYIEGAFRSLVPAAQNYGITQLDRWIESGSIKSDVDLIRFQLVDESDHGEDIPEFYVRSWQMIQRETRRRKSTLELYDEEIPSRICSLTRFGILHNCEVRSEQELNELKGSLRDHLRGTCDQNPGCRAILEAEPVCASVAALLQATWSDEKELQAELERHCRLIKDWIRALSSDELSIPVLVAMMKQIDPALAIKHTDGAVTESSRYVIGAPVRIIHDLLEGLRNKQDASQYSKQALRVELSERLARIELQGEEIFESLPATAGIGQVGQSVEALKKLIEWASSPEHPMRWIAIGQEFTRYGRCVWFDFRAGLS